MVSPMKTINAPGWPGDSAFLSPEAPEAPEGCKDM